MNDPIANPNTDELSQRHCVPCEGGTSPLSADRAQTLLTQVPGWQLSADGITIQRRFEFKGFYKTMAFINAMAWIANSEDHHPDFEAGYNFCVVNFTTHAIGGLSENDFICAARLNALLERA
jgi:4a-hydroxytetrahydrobiopterin dehydratase